MGIDPILRPRFSGRPGRKKVLIRLLSAGWEMVNGVGLAFKLLPLAHATQSISTLKIQPIIALRRSSVLSRRAHFLRGKMEMPGNLLGKKPILLAHPPAAIMNNQWNTRSVFPV